MMSIRDRQTYVRPAGEIPGVIETIGLAYTRLLARPWIVLGPIILDLYLWLGLKITAGPLVLKIADSIRPIAAIGDSVAKFVEGQAQYNLAELLSMHLFVIRMPTFMPMIDLDESVRLADWGPELSSGPWGLLGALVPLFIAAGFGGGAAFLLMVGDVSRGAAPRFDARLTIRTGYRLLLWVLAGAGLFVLISWPLLVVQAALIYAGSGVNGIVLFLLSIPTGLGFVLFFFSAYAIVLDGATATEAFRSSYRVVRAYGWQSLAFIVSYMIATGGFPFFWRLLVDEPPGTLIAIIGNAFISTGMIAAGMIYYEDRHAIVGSGDPVFQAG
ncbi:hypothetical protein BH23CHL2_BH23CHL2_34750 [soil metagenome]